MRGYWGYEFGASAVAPSQRRLLLGGGQVAGRGEGEGGGRSIALSGAQGMQQ